MYTLWAFCCFALDCSSLVAEFDGHNICIACLGARHFLQLPHSITKRVSSLPENFLQPTVASLGRCVGSSSKSASTWCCIEHPYTSQTERHTALDSRYINRVICVSRISPMAMRSLCQPMNLHPGDGEPDLSPSSLSQSLEAFMLLPWVEKMLRLGHENQFAETCPFSAVLFT